MPLPIYNPDKKLPQAIAVAAGKGGVGKSTVAVHLAVALQERGFQVGLLDMDLYGPSVRRMLLEDRMPTQNGERITPALSRGMKVISMAYFRKEHEAAIVRAPIANGIITQFLKDVDWGELDYLIIDYPPGTGDIQLTLSQQIPLSGALLVTTPQEMALMDVRKTIYLFDQMNVPLLGVLENMAHFKGVALFGEGGGKRLAEEVGAQFLGQLPIDPTLCERADQGLTLYDEGGESDVRKTFDSVVDQVLLQLKKGSSSLAVKEITRVDNKTFSVNWSDQRTMTYKIHELQKKCPCAGCKEGVSSATSSDVMANRFIKVGHYALKIEFSQGCSHGIYDYDFLRELGEEACV